MTGYVKSPSDTAYIISGLKKEPKYVIGRSSIRIPFLQRMDKLMLKMISVDVKTEDSVPTNDYINVNIDSAVKVKVSSDPAKMKIAASNFLNKNEEYIRSSVVDVLQGIPTDNIENTVENVEEIETDDNDLLSILKSVKG